MALADILLIVNISNQ